MRVALIAGAALTAAACASYPTEPRYSTRVDGADSGAIGTGAAAPIPPQMTGQPYPGRPVEPSEPAESPPPATAPVGSIEGGTLPSAGAPVGQAEVASPAPVPTRPTAPSPAPRPVAPPAVLPAAGAGYVIQPGDTLSGVGRRFRTPVQTLIDLNALGPQGSIRGGQTLLLPQSAVDTGSDPYATGPAPSGVRAGNASSPAPTPPRGNAAVPRPATPVTQTPAPAPAPPRPVVPAAPVPAAPVPVAPVPAAPVTATPRPTAPAPAPARPSTATPATGSVNFQWPLRGDILRRYGPIGLGERNNGINIGGTQGASVVAAASGRVAYVGSALPGQGLTVLIMHRDGWRTVYGHLGSATVDDGADVRAGQQIGTVGTTAGDGRPSIHFETRRMQGDNPTAVDPLTVLPR